MKQSMLLHNVRPLLLVQAKFPRADLIGKKDTDDRYLNMKYVSTMADMKTKRRKYTIEPIRNEANGALQR